MASGFSYADAFDRNLGWFTESEQQSLRGKTVAIAGMGGVVVLLGVDAGGGTWALVGGLMVLLAGLGYAAGGFYLKRRLADLEPAGVGAATMAISTLVTLPLALANAPDAMPGAGAIAAVGALGVVGTGIAFWIFYTLISMVGPAKASIVAYIAPAFAVIYGVTLLGESFTLGTAAGLVLIVGGSWLAGDGRLPRRRGKAATGVVPEAAQG